MAPGVNWGELRLHIKTLVPPDIATETWVASTDQVFRAARIKVNLVSVEVLNLTVTEIDVGKCDGQNLTPVQAALFANRNNARPTEVVVYVARSLIPPMEGCAACPPGLPSLILSQSASIWALAHELGHLLGLDHVDDDDNLMTGSGAENITNAPPDLTDEQIAVLRASPLVRLSSPTAARAAIKAKPRKSRRTAGGRTRQ